MSANGGEKSLTMYKVENIGPACSLEEFLGLLGISPETPEASEPIRSKKGNDIRTVIAKGKGYYHCDEWAITTSPSPGGELSLQVIMRVDAGESQDILMYRLVAIAYGQLHFGSIAFHLFSLQGESEFGRRFLSYCAHGGSAVSSLRYFDKATERILMERFSDQSIPVPA